MPALPSTGIAGRSQTSKGAGGGPRRRVGVARYPAGTFAALAPQDASRPGPRAQEIEVG
jgi:hypothetical protein